MYDKQNHTYKFTDGSVECDVTWFFDWVDLPQPIKDYITARAAGITSTRIIGDSTQYKMLQQKESYMRAMAVEYECNQGDYTFFGTTSNNSKYNSYKPHTALIR